MDKSWISNERLSHSYRLGVDNFLDFAEQNAENKNSISCPCTRCGNLRHDTIDRVRAHLFVYGMDKNYLKWVWHGERSVSSSSIHHSHDPVQEEDLTTEPYEDLVQEAYEKTENVETFMKLLEDAEKPLYPDNIKFTKLSAIVKLYNLKARHAWSDTSMNDLLSLLVELLPEGNTLPSTLYEAKKSLVALGMNYEKIHACPNDCVLYRKELKDQNECPTCGISRWKVGRNGKFQKQIPSKVVWYFPPIPRFQRMFRNKQVSKDLSWHADKRVCDGYLRHPADAPCWKVVDHKWIDFASETRNLRLALSTDGINPFSNMTSTYSCWPVILVTYNLPPWLCMKRKFMMLTMLISGPKQPGNDIDVYLALLVEDLQRLWQGVVTYDAYRDETFLLRAVLLWTINDLPAYGNVSGLTVKGYYACPVCGEGTYAKRLKHSRKTSYTGHRRFLQTYHPYRRQKKSFDGQPEFGVAPKPLTGREVLQRVQGIECSWGKKHRPVKPKGFECKTCWKKKSIFFNLEYWEHLHVRHILDVMHIEKNVCESLIGTLLDIPGKTKDGLAARKDLKELQMRSELAPVEEDNRTYLPAALYTLSKKEKKKVCQCLAGMKVPSGYSSNVHKLVSIKDSKLIGLKSHDCHTLMQQLLPVALRGVLPDDVRVTITKLCLFFNVLCSKVIDTTKLDDLQREVVKTLCLLEKYFPPSFFDITVHLIVHLVREVKLCGPVWYRWMYPFERYMKVLKGYVRNRNRPEGSIAECYIAEEAIEFCSDYLSNMNTVGIPRSHGISQHSKHKSVARVSIVSTEELVQAHLHILTNDPDLESYICEHKEHLRSVYGKKNRSEKWFHDQHNKLFISWLKDRVATDYAKSGHQISGKTRRLAEGPSHSVFKYHSYLVNGVTYNTKERDNDRVTQNSGVSLVAKTMQLSSAKDKNPIVSDMVFYGYIEEIWEMDYHDFTVPLFKCAWANNRTGVKVDDIGFTLVNFNNIGFKEDSFVLCNLVKQVFYIEDPIDEAWSVVLATPSKEYFLDGEIDESEAISMHYECFSKGLDSKDTTTLEDDEPPCIRKDCDGIWVENLNA